MSLSAWNNSATTEGISKKFDIWVFFEKVEVSLKPDKKAGKLHEDLRKFIIPH
jgi:hypothetical protein